VLIVQLKSVTGGGEGVTGGTGVGGDGIVEFVLFSELFVVIFVVLFVSFELLVAF
jgi:hypothetical protein